MTDQGNVHGQYCPISRAVEVLGERWTLLILRDLIVGTTKFNALSRGLPGLSRTLLTKRLRQLEAAGLVERFDGEYLLTEAGRGLEPILFGLGDWAARWIFGEPRAGELDAQLLVWWMHTRLDTSALPDRRTVLHFRFTDDRRRFWIVVDSSGPSVCLADPGYDIDVTVSSDMSTLYQVWLGHLPLKDAQRSGRLRFEGTPALVRRMPLVLRLSPMAPIVAGAT